jgi:hypothetical protein
MHPSNAPAAQLKDEAKFWLAYSLIPLFPYSLIPLFFVFASNEAETDLTLNCEQFR